MDARVPASRRHFLGGAALVLGAGTALAAAGKAKAAPRCVAAQSSWTPPPPLAPASEGQIAVNGASLFYWDTGGRGEPVVLLHPATGSAAIWGYQQPALVAAGYRVIAYSRRGHRGSRAGTGPAVPAASDDLRAVADALGLDRFHLVGSAAGGFIVPDFALSHPERLLSLTIASSQGGVTDPDYRARIAAMTPDSFRQMPASLRELGPAYRVANPQGTAQWEALEHAALSGEARIVQPARHALTWSDIERITTPALMFTGSADLYMPPPLMTEYAGHLRDCETAIIAEAGHSAYWEQPLAFNRLVIDFIRRHPSKRRQSADAQDTLRPRKGQHA